MLRSIIIVAWFALALAIFAWAGVAFFAYQIGVLESARAAGMQSSQQQSEQSAQASYLHGLVAGSAAARTQLDALVNIDPVSLANMVDSAGSSHGVGLAISNASAENVSSAGGRTTTQSFSFIVTSKGNFASVMYAAALLGTLPVPSSVQEINLVQAPAASGAAGGAWQMSAQVQVLSASNISS
jgi:hypothetical protein